MHEEEYDKEERKFYETLKKGSRTAKENGMKLSKFKIEISKGLSTTNDEDQWTFDYQSFLGAISNGIYKTPSNWAAEYYQGRWSLI